MSGGVGTRTPRSSSKGPDQAPAAMTTQAAGNVPRTGPDRRHPAAVDLEPLDAVPRLRAEAPRREAAVVKARRSRGLRTWARSGRK